MNRKRDTLLQQISENSRNSTVFFGTGYISEHPVGFGKKIPRYLKHQCMLRQVPDSLWNRTRS